MGGEDEFNAIVRKLGASFRFSASLTGSLRVSGASQDSRVGVTARSSEESSEEPIGNLDSICSEASSKKDSDRAMRTQCNMQSTSSTSTEAEEILLHVSDLDLLPKSQGI